MHVFFSGIGGTGIGPLALIATQAGYQVSGSDKQDSQYIHYLKKKGVTDITIGQTTEDIAAVHAKHPIDWIVYSSAVAKEHSDHPELAFAAEHTIRTSKRDGLLNKILEDKHLKLIAIAGTHGKTTTTAMAIWLFKQCGVPVSYSVGAKISFGEMGQYDQASEYFVYECDEYDRNFLAFKPQISLITGIDWDHADIFPARENYEAAFREFIHQSLHASVWQADISKLALSDRPSDVLQLNEHDDMINQLTLPGIVNRKDAWQVAKSLHEILGVELETAIAHLNNFPGVSRRFEQIARNIYSDYAHTPEKIRGALQLAHEVAGDNVVVVYEGLHNTRQHFIKDDLKHLFDSAKQLYVVPSYLARENKDLPLLSQTDLIALTSQPDKAAPHSLNDALQKTIQTHVDAGDLVLCLTAGGGGSLDEWLRTTFSQ